MDDSFIQYECSHCDMCFTEQSNLNRHTNIFHQELETTLSTQIRKSDPLFKCLEGNGCESTFRHCRMLIMHLIKEHNVNVDTHELEFDCLEDFQNWLELLKQTESVTYFRTRGKRIQKTWDEKSLEKSYFYCSRTGKPRVIPDELRVRKAEGSYKSEVGCTSKIVLSRDPETNKCEVTYVSSHYGHDFSKEVPKRAARKRRRTETTDSTNEGFTCQIEYVQEDYDWKEQMRIQLQEIDSTIDSADISSEDQAYYLDVLKTVQAGLRSTTSEEIHLLDGSVLMDIPDLSQPVLLEISEEGKIEEALLNHDHTYL